MGLGPNFDDEDAVSGSIILLARDLKNRVVDFPPMLGMTSEASVLDVMTAIRERELINDADMNRVKHMLDMQERALAEDTPVATPIELGNIVQNYGYVLHLLENAERKLKRPG